MKYRKLKKLLKNNHQLLLGTPDIEGNTSIYYEHNYPTDCDGYSLEADIPIDRAKFIYIASGVDCDNAGRPYAHYYRETNKEVKQTINIYKPKLSIFNGNKKKFVKNYKEKW